MEEFLKALTENLLNSDWLNFLALIITVIASLIISSGERLSDYSRERHEKLITPLFILLEPILYKTYDETVVQQAMRIIDENINFADGDLLSIRAGCQRDPSANFKELCRYIDKAYDHSCKKLKLKVRDTFYRINQRQYESRFSLIFHVILLSLWNMFLAVIIMLVIVYIIAIAAGIAFSLFNAAPVPVQLVATILILFSSFIVLRKLYE